MENQNSLNEDKDLSVPRTETGNIKSSGEREAKLARIEALKVGNRAMKAALGMCEKCGCTNCPGCDYDHDCFD